MREKKFKVSETESSKPIARHPISNIFDTSVTQILSDKLVANDLVIKHEIEEVKQSY